MNTANTVIWLKVPSIASSATEVVNMYYGETGATAASNGDATFILFDDFTGSSLNSTKWTFTQSGGTATVSGGVITISNSSYGLVQSVNSYTGPYYSECKVNSVTGSYPSMAQADNGNYNSGATMFLSGSTLYFYATSGSPGYSSSLSNAQSLGTAAGIWSIVRTPSSGMICKWPGGSYTYTGPNASSSTNQSSAFGNLNGSSSTMVVDYYRARKYDAAGTTQTVGAEAINGAGPIAGTTVFCGNDTFTYTNSTPSGVWTSSNTSVATINASTGFMQGVAAGTSTIVYTVGACAPASKIITIKQSPGPILNFNSVVCSDVTMTLSNAVAGGTWTSTNSGVVAINASTGFLEPQAGGVATISYTLSSGCSVFRTQTVNLAPKAITGSNKLCTGLSTTLSDVIVGGVWSSSNASATVNASTGVVTGVTSGNPYITYTIPSGGCYVVFPMTINNQPAPITGTAAVCVGSSVSLNSTTPGGTWTSSDPFQASVTPGAGFVSGLSAGMPSISYTLAGGCSAVVTATVNAVPDIAAITGSGRFCLGETHYFTSGESGGTWLSSNPSVISVDPSGTATAMASGTAGVSYKFTATGCTTTIPSTVNALPTVYSVGGGGGYCSGGTGTHVTLSNSDIGVIYKLYNDNSGIEVTSQTGSMSSIDFGAMTAVATYTVQATNAAGCVKDMAGAAVVTINNLPAPQTLAVTGLAAYCYGGSGVHLNLNNSETGVNYQLFNSLGVAGPVISGTGSGPLDLGTYTAETYTAKAINVSTGCTDNMLGSATVTATPLPTVYPVVSTSSSTAYCAGTGGVDVSMFNAESGVTYNLLRNSVFVKAVTAAVTGPLAFGGNQTVAGAYTVVAVDSAAGCISNMSGSINVTVNAAPAIQTVSGGGSYCAGTGGKHINLLYSVSGVNYTLNDGTGPVVTISGSNSGLDFGAITNPGIYTVVAEDALGCTSNMAGSASIVQTPVPNPHFMAGGGPYCAGEAGKAVTMPTSDLGIRYQLYKDGVSIGAPKPGPGAINFGIFSLPGTYTVVAQNIATSCKADMPNNVSISINPLPDMHTVSGGDPYCAGDPAGTKIYVDTKGDLGIDYSLILGGVQQDIEPGNDERVVFDNVLPVGTYKVIAINPGTTCQREMLGSVVVKINPLPVNYTVTGGGAYCQGGAGLPIGYSLSATGIEYTLLESGNPAGPVLGGTGAKLNFGTFGAGSYTIQAKNLATGCMNTTAATNIVMHNLPVQHTVSGSASFCANDTGSHIMLDGSDTTAAYTLLRNGVATGSAVAGVNGMLDLGLQATGGTYTVMAMDTANLCTVNMLSSAVLNATPVPALYDLSIVGSVMDTSRCAFDLTGLPMNLGGSQLGIRYQVYTETGMPDLGFFAGTGLPIYLGLHTLPGYYKVVATDPATGCSATMEDSVKINIRANTVPTDTIRVVGGADSVCTGKMATFYADFTNGGTAPVFTWKVDGTAVGSGSSLTYAPKSGEVVTVIMKSNADCAFPATITSLPLTVDAKPTALPTVTVTPSVAGPVCPGTKVNFSIASTWDGGADASYTWIQNGVPVATGKTYAYTPTDSIVVFAELRSAYKCRTADWVLSNNVSVSINEPVLPVVSIDASSGTTVNKGQALTLKAVVANKGSFTYQWSVHGTEVAFATNPSFTYNYTLDNEDVKCVVTSHSSCGSLSSSKSVRITVRDNTGVRSVTSGSEVRVSPNPNKGTFMVSGNLGLTTDEDVTLELTNMLGQKVYSNHAMSRGGAISEQVQLSNAVAPGMYLMSVRSASVNEVFHVVIEQ